MKKKLLVSLIVLGILSINAVAGTGGAEIQSWYTDLSSSLQGFWGKVIAVAFIGIAIILFKSGAIVGGIFMVMLGLGVGGIPDMVDAKYTALAMETQSVGISIANLFQ